MEKKKNRLKVVEDSDKAINYITIFLALFGLTMAISASMTTSDNSTKLLLLTSGKQLGFLIIGYFVMVIASRLFNYKHMRFAIMPLSIFMTIALFAPLAYREVNGAKAWIRFSIAGQVLTIQPSEFAKVFLILLVAMYLGDLSLNTNRSKKEIINPVLYILFIQVFIVLVLQKDLGSAVILFLIGLFTALIPAHPKLKTTQNFLILLIVVGIGASIFLLSDKGLELIAKTKILKGYQLNRFLDYANPFINASGSGYQLAGSLVAFARGGLFGVGLGQSIQKYGYLPEASTDFILPLIGEEIGFLGVLLVLILYFALIYRLYYFARKVSSERDKIILMGTVLYLFLHILLNAGGSSGTIPLTGVPLLLVSSGGSSTVSIMLAIGLSQNVISKYKKGISK